jgi:hypothetical protein
MYRASRADAAGGAETQSWLLREGWKVDGGQQRPGQTNLLEAIFAVAALRS